MNKKALQDAYSIFKTGGYEGNINDFFNLIKTNDKARNDAFSMFSARGFEDDIESFGSLIGLDKAYTANGGYVKDDYKEGADGRRNYFNSETNEYDLKEVGYEYDRSKGVRFDKDQFGFGTMGRIFDDFAYNFIKPGVEITIDAVKSGQSGEYTDAMNEMIIKGKKGMTEEQAAKTIELMRKQQQQGPSENIANWAKEMEEEDNKVYGFLKATYNNPGAAYEAIISSMAGQIKATQDGELVSLATTVGGATAAVGSTVGPIGTIAGFIRGFMSTMGGGVESASKFGELLVEEFGGQMPTEQELIDFLGDEEKFKKFRNKSLAKGGTIALIDNIGGGVVQSSVLKTAKKGKKALAATKGMLGEAVVGGGGEAVSSTIIGDEVNAVDVGLEILGQGGQSTVDVGSALITPGKYKVKGEKATLKQVNEILNTATPEEIANIDIQIENDPVLEAEYNKKRQNGYLRTQVDPAVSNPNDRARAAELQLEKEQLEAKIKKGGIFKGVNTETKLENVNKEIDGILNKYSPGIGPAVDPAGVEARTVVKDEAYNNRLQLLKDEITKGVKQTKFYRKANISVKEDNADNVTEMFVKQEADNLGYDLTLLNNELSETTDAKRKNQITKKIAEVEAEIQALDENSKEAKNAHGFLLEDNATGEMTIVINTSKDISSAGNINVAAHELLHAVLRNTFLKETGLRARELKGTGVETGQGLLDYLVENEEMQLLFPGGIIDRLKSYADGDAKGQEVLNLLSDAMVGTNYKAENQTFWQGLGSRISDVLQAYLPERFTNKLNFGDGKQVFDFIKTFNKAVAGDVVSGRIIERTSRRGVDVKQKPTKEAAKTPLSKEASDNVQRIYEDRGDAGAFDIIEAFKPITSKIVQKRSEAPNFDRELLTSEIEIGKRGILDLIREYNVDSGVPLAAYINKFLPARAIEASRRVLGEEFTTDITERVDVAAEEVTQEPTQPKKKKIVLADRLGVTDKVSKAINKIVPNLELDKLNFKTLKNKVPVITGDLFGISPKKIENLANLTKKELQSAQMFINKNADLLISMLPEGATASGTATGVPNTLLKAFYTKADRAKMAKTGSKAGLAIQQKNNINKTDFLETFGIIDGKPDRTDRNTSARVLALASLTGKMITNQAVRLEVGEATITAKETVSRLKDGKSKVMFSKNNFKEIYENKVGALSNALGYKLSPKKTAYRINSKGKRVPYQTRDLDVKFNNKETYRDAGVRVINTFLDSHPQFRELIKITMTGGEQAGFFQTVPNFNELINKTEVEQRYIGRTKYGGKGGVYDINHYNKLKKGELNKDNNQRLPLLLEFYEAIGAHLQNFPDDIWMFEEMLLDTGKQQNVFTRILAPFAFYPINPKTGKPIFNQKIAEEHTDPQNLIGKAMLSGAFFGNLDQVWKVVGKSYMQGAILNSTQNPHDKTINSAGYQSSMPDIYYEKIVPRLISGELNLPNGYSSIVRLAAAGIDLNMYYLTEANMSIAEFFKVDKIKDIKNQNELIIQQLSGETTADYAENISKVPFSKDIDSNKTLSDATQFSRSNNESKGITVLDFDDTLATTKSLVKFTTPDGKTGTLNAEQFASTYEDLQDQGYTFDFSDFNKVVKGKLAPLFNKAIKLQGKFGPENMFVLTARPPQAQKAIFDFLKANGLNIPIKNITGLGNSTAEAKALWMADKVSDGYNDFYFADDALQNVQAVKNMLDQFDVKSKVQQAKVQFSKDASSTFNDIIQETTGIESQKVFSEAQAKIRGQKSKYKSIIPPSAQDFGGLLYSFLGKGKKGEQDMAFFKKALIDPFARGINELNAARQASANDYENLLKQFPEVKKLLNKKIEGTDYTHDQAVRIYLWNKAGFEIPGLSKRDLNSVVDFVENNSKVQAFADTIGLISKKEDGYSAPGDYWLAENIKSDLLSDGSIGDARAEFLAEWQQNADLIFSTENLNKIEAIYGSNFREALEDVLYRMKTGRNRPAGGGRLMNIYTNWVNNSVGAIMFFNMRSALLQTISATNYINWSDNNPLKAAAAFANQKQYWSDFSYLFNSDYLKQRRSGNQRGINEAELSAAVAGAENKAKAAIAWLLKKGFLPTQIADSFAIASGGATFYRNRIKALVKEGMTQEQAEKQAFLDFQETTEVAQQSARPDMISQQQASPLGKLILAFQNTPMQYARIMNKAARDIYNGRGDYKTHTSKIIYYGFVQSIIFGALQSALFASLDDEDEEKFDKKKERILNGMIDSVLSGIGYGGKAISTMKNTLTTFLDQRKRGFNADHTYTILQLLGFSPPIGSKLRKVYSSIQTDKFNKDVFKRRGFTLDNPIWSAVGNVVEGVTNVPLGRFSQKMLNIDNALDANNKWWQRTALVLGWNTWDLGIKDADIEDIKKEIKKEKKVEAKEKTRIKREEKKKEKEEENKSIIEENKKKSKKDGLCSAVSKGGKRCKKKAINGGMCTIHEKAVQRKDGKQTQCIKRKSNGKRCGMKTSSKSGLCYYHD